MSDHVLAYMKAKGIKLTRKNYLALAYLGKPPAELDGEQEAEIPAELLDQDVIDIRTRQPLVLEEEE